MVNACAIRNIIVVNLIRLCKLLAISIKQTIEKSVILDSEIEQNTYNSVGHSAS